MNRMLKKLLPHCCAILGFLLILVAYFLPQLEGKVVTQSDIVQYMGMSQEAREFKKETGENTLWTNSMFGGMPTYQINTVNDGNTLQAVDKLASLGIKAPIGRFFVAMLGFYILLLVLGVNPWLSIVGAIAFGLTTNSLILYEAGHETKVKAIAYFPLVAAGMLLAFNKKYLWGGVLFAVGLGLNIFSNHVQMTYYFFLTVAFLGIAQLIYAAQKNELADFFKAVGALVIAGILAVGASASNLWISYEYSKDTMRGDPILQAEAKPEGVPDDGMQSSSETSGLSWDYAMQWSNGTIDLFSAFIPGAAGGGSQEAVDQDGPIGSALKAKGYRAPPGLRAPLYWGELPFTSGPIYFGAVVCLLFFMGLTLVKGPAKWWLALGTLLTLLLSMGKNMEAVNRFFFDYVPLFNKFRTPNSVLSVASFLVPALGFLALHQLISGKSEKQEALRSLYIGGGITGGLALFLAILGPGMFDFSNPSDGQYAAQFGSIDPSAFVEERQAYLRGDAFRTLILILLSGGLIWAYLKNKIKASWLIAGIGILVFFDMWTVGRRYLNTESFTSKTNYQANFQPNPADQQILQDQDPNFRVLDLVGQNPFQSSRASYFHKSLGGYHAAKLQRYQDVIDRHLSKGNPQVLSMLNTRYIIGGDSQETAQVRPNPAAAGNAWFVSSIQMVNTPNEEIAALDSFVAMDEAIIHQEYSDYLKGLNIQRSGTIRLTDYKPNHLTYESDATSEQLAVFSEIWYGPNKGWQAYIDGQAAEHIRANYLLRAMRIPAGQHKIEFRFDPPAYRAGKTVSLIASSIILLALLGCIGYFGKNYYQRLSEMEPEPVKPVSTGKPTKGRKN